MGGKMTQRTPRRKPLSKLPKIESGAKRFARRLAQHLKRRLRVKGAAGRLGLAILLFAASGNAQSLNDVYMWTQVGSRQMGQFRALTTSNVAEGSNLYHTTARVRNSLGVVLPLVYDAGTGIFSLTGLSALGSTNQMPGMNAAGTALEWKTIAGGSIISISHGVGSLTLGINANSIGTGQIGTAGVGTDELVDSSVTSRKFPLGNIVRSIGGLFDNIAVAGENGASVRTAPGPTHDSLVISSEVTSAELPVFITGYYRSGVDSVVVPVPGITAGRRLEISWGNAGTSHFGVLSASARTDSIGVYSNWVEPIDSLLFTILIEGINP